MLDDGVDPGLGELRVSTPAQEFVPLAREETGRALPVGIRHREDARPGARTSM